MKTFEICDLPARSGKFIARKNWFVVGSDDLHLRVYNYNTHEKVSAFEAHNDYIRFVALLITILAQTTEVNHNYL